MRKLLAILFLAAAAGAAAAAWYLLTPEVAVVAPTRGKAVQAVFATGTVEPVTWAKVTPMVRGRIIEQCRCEGDRVSPGTVLARLEDREARARVSELEARETFLKEEVARYQSLAQRKVVSIAAYDRILSDHSQVQAAVAAARERLAYYELRAPIEGVVLRRDGEVGEIVAPGDIVFWIGKPKPLWIVAEVDEEDIPRVEIGQESLVKSDAFPDRVLRGAVHRITPKGDPVNKSFRVRILLPADTPLLVGMTTEINIIVRVVEDAMLVPSDAIVDGRLWVVQDGTARPRKVETGIKGNRVTQILAGVGAEDRIIVDPPSDLRAGQRVRIRR